MSSIIASDSVITNINYEYDFRHPRPLTATYVLHDKFVVPNRASIYAIYIL